MNGPANPASHGSSVMVYMTSGGATNPPGEDGQIVSQIEGLQLPVRVEVGGVPAPMDFAGSPLGLIKGALQVNIRIPEDAPSGNAVPLVIWVGGMRSQEGVTLAIQ